MTKEEAIRILNEMLSKTAYGGSSELGGLAVKKAVEALRRQEEPVSDRFAFKAIPRLLEMIEPTDRAKAYTAKLADTLEVEGYSTDAKIIRESLKIMNGEKVPMATMDEEPVSKDTKESVLYNDMKHWEVTEYIIEAINKKRVCPTFKGEALHKFKNEFNTLKQTLHLLYNLDTSVNYRLALHWASWGAQNLQGCFGISEEEKDNALTWEDVCAILYIEREVLREKSNTDADNEDICKEVLKRFLEQKGDKVC